MSAGGIIGMFFNFFVFAAVWTVIGYAVEKLGHVFNMTIAMIPTLQDAVNGFSVVQMIYGVIPVVFALILIVDYYMNEHSHSSMEA